MRYWDSSGLVPLVLDEPSTPLARAWLREDPQIVTWAMTRLEIVSAIERRVREGAVSRANRRAVLERFERLWSAWDEVTELLVVRARAAALLARHPLRAADAVQLASALLVAGDDARSVPMVCLDRRLAETAEREGLTVLTWPDEPPA